MYKIKFYLQSAISFVEIPTFDSILAWCYLRDKGIVEQQLNIKTQALHDFADLPIKRHKDGYFMASWLIYDKENSVEFVSTWKKRWANQHDFLADFGKKPAKILISKGDYKSYDIPIVLHNIPECYFYVETDNIAEVERLIKTHLWGMGKKSSQGYGQIEKYEIETIDYNPFAEIIRPIPIPKEVFLQGKLNVKGKLMGWRPPYWLPENQTFCHDI